MTNAAGHDGLALPLHAAPQGRPEREGDSASGASEPGFDFFRHHGLWAPGIRLFRRMRFAAKAAIVSAVFLVPVVTLGVSVFRDKADAIVFSAKERDGVAYMKATTPLLQLAQRLRLMPTGGESIADPAALRAEIANRLAALESHDQQFGAALNTGTAFEAVMKAGRSFNDAATGPAAAEAGTAFAAALAVLIERAADGSNLTLDPEIDTVYLMNTLVANLPVVVDKMVVQTLLATGPGDGPHPSTAFLTAQALGELSAARIKNELGKVYGVHPEYQAQLRDDVMREKLRDASRLLAGDRADAKAGAAKAVEALRAVWTLQDQAAERLDSLLAARVAHMTLARNVIAAVVAGSLLLAAYLFFAFFLVTQGGLAEVEKHLQAMTRGDLTTEPRPWGRDEAALLMGALADMQQSLRGIVSKVRVSSMSIVHASNEIAAASIDLSSRTEQTASHLEKSAASMEQISSTAKQTAANSQRAATAATENASAASRGGSAIGDVVATMQDIHTSSSKINEIIGTIDGIAFQTNILALNAAVEAARAGEQGRGFAVVAAEVRNLAQRSAGAARQIKTLITTSVEHVDSGAKRVRVAGDTMDHLLATAQQTQQLLAEISTAAAEQSQGVSYVGEAVSQLEQMTQQNAALVEQSAAAAASLHAQAQHLAQEVSQFKLPAGQGH